jgi:protein tyrosine/serine phosphatase
MFAMMKKTIVFAAAAAMLLLVSCSDSEGGSSSAPVISGHITEVNGYGQPIPDFTPAQMKDAGFDYADLINVTIGKVRLRNVPYVSSFNEVAILGPSYVDYNARGDDFGFAMLNGDFHYYIGGEVGDKVTMKLAQKGGYSATYELMKSVYPEEQRDGETAAEYANFRMVTTTGIAPGVLYRSSNPLNCVNNPSRYRVVDSLAREVGINTEIDLADTPEKIDKYMATEGYASTYCPQLYKEGRTIACGMMANSFCDDFKTRLGKAVRFMLEHEPPYLLHCNEGKDRCGFVSMLFEALAGASVDELRADYMTTMINFYKIDAGSESYEKRRSLSIDRMIWLMCNEEALENYKEIDWDNTDVSNIDWEGLGMYRTNNYLQGPTLKASAKKYLMECGLSDEECEALRTRLTSPLEQ